MVHMLPPGEARTYHQPVVNIVGLLNSYFFALLGGGELHFGLKRLIPTQANRPANKV
jgi:hypothetical protein